jgi:hypothetical protein
MIDQWLICQIALGGVVLLLLDFIHISKVVLLFALVTHPQVIEHVMYSALQ